MPIVVSSDRINYESLLPVFATAKRVWIVTFSFELTKSNVLWQALQSIPKNSSLMIIACIPECAMNFHRTDEGESAARIARYYKALDPSNFTCRTEILLNHHNHSKIILCDRKAYVGSANFTMGSASSFEAGFVTEDDADLIRIDSFVRDVRERSIPYFNVASSLFVQQLLQFSADTAWLKEQVQDHSYTENQVYKDQWELKFSLEQFGVPTRVVHSIRAAVSAANGIDDKNDNDAVLTPGERSIYDANISGALADLAAEADSINKQDRIDDEITESAATSSLTNAYACDENPADVPGFQERVREKLETNHERRYAEAKKQIESFLDSLTTVGEKISSTLGAPPATTT